MTKNEKDNASSIKRSNKKPTTDATQSFHNKPHTSSEHVQYIETDNK